MKRITILFLICLFMPAFCTMADTIVLSDGTSMPVYNIQIAQKWIFYTESDNEDAEVKKIPVDKVFAYKVGDGQMTSIGSMATAQPSENRDDPMKPRKIDPIPSDDNEVLIAAYNNHPPLRYVGKEPQPDKHTNNFLSLWGIENGSILSDNNIEIGFEPVYLEDDSDRSVVGYHLKVTNKTGAAIYVDLASCYKIINGGYAIPYFTNSTYTESSSKTTGGSLNIGAVAGALGIGGVLGRLAGGINVGSANTKSTGITTVEQQIITIPPYSAVCLPGEKLASGKEIVECYEPIYFNNRTSANTTIQDATHWGYDRMVATTQAMDQKTQKIADDPNANKENLNIGVWSQSDYPSTKSPKKIGRIITYSTSPDFSTYTSLPVTLYMRGAFGINMRTLNLRLYFNDKTYIGIDDKEHFIVGSGLIKNK